MTEFDKKWMVYLCIVLAITFLLGRAAYWILTTACGTVMTNEAGETVVEVSSLIDVIRKLVTPLLMVIGLFATTSAYYKHRDNDTE